MVSKVNQTKVAMCIIVYTQTYIYISERGFKLLILLNVSGEGGRGGIGDRGSREEFDFFGYIPNPGGSPVRMPMEDFAFGDISGPYPDGDPENFSCSVF